MLKLCCLFTRFLNLFQHPLLLAVRLYWGWGFFMAGMKKLQDIDKVIGLFTSLGIPYPQYNAWLVGSVECFGGLLLMVGLASRLAAVPLTITMIVAYATAHVDAVKTILVDQKMFFEQPPFLFLYALVLVLCFGPGFFSLDRLIGAVLKKKRGDEK